MKIIGIDIGTTAICGVVIDTESGNVIKSCAKNSNAFISGCDEWEKIQSVDKIINIATDILDEIIDDEVEAIGVTGQMHGIVYTDNNGNAVSQLYTWQDERGNLSYKNTTYADYIGSYSGYGAVTDFYNRENDLRPSEAVSYCTIHDYFVMKICSLCSPIIHETDFASFGRGADCGLGKVVSGYVLAGEYKDIPVSVAIGDNQASAFSTLKTDDCILINIGTGSQVSVVSDNPVETENIESRPYFDGKYLVVGAALCGGRAYSILKKFFVEVVGDADDNEIYSRMAEMTKGIEPTLKVDTRFAGTRNDKTITGSIENIRENNFTPGQLVLGVIDGMVTELYNMYAEMKMPRFQMVGSGNGIRKNSILINRAEKKFGIQMLIPVHVEEAAYGAALYAGICSEVLENSAHARRLIKHTTL